MEVNFLNHTEAIQCPPHTEVIQYLHCSEWAAKKKKTKKKRPKMEQKDNNGISNLSFIPVIADHNKL